MISVKQTNELCDYVAERLKSGTLTKESFKELFEVRSRLTDIIAHHYVKRNDKRYGKH